MQNKSPPLKELQRRPWSRRNQVFIRARRWSIGDEVEDTGFFFLNNAVGVDGLQVKGLGESSIVGEQMAGKGGRCRAVWGESTGAHELRLSGEAGTGPPVRAACSPDLVMVFWAHWASLPLNISLSILFFLFWFYRPILFIPISHQAFQEHCNLPSCLPWPLWSTPFIWDHLWTILYYCLKLLSISYVIIWPPVVFVLFHPWDWQLQEGGRCSALLCAYCSTVDSDPHIAGHSRCWTCIYTDYQDSYDL